MTTMKIVLAHQAAENYCEFSRYFHLSVYYLSINFHEFWAFMAHGFSVSRILPNRTPIPFSRRGAKARRKIITGYTFQRVFRTRTTFRSVSIGVHPRFIGSSLAPDESEHMDAVAPCIPSQGRGGMGKNLESILSQRSQRFSDAFNQLWIFR